MNLNGLKNVLKLALDKGENQITRHISDVQGRGRTGGIEEVFSDLVNDQLCADGNIIKREVDLNEIGLEQRYEGRATGRLDCLVENTNCGIEYKAVSLPRTQSDSRFDVGQLLADYLRLDNPVALNTSYLVVFLYGSHIASFRSAGGLYRAFHNQMFVDLEITKDPGSPDPEHFLGLENTIEKLRWNRPCRLAQVPKDRVSVLRGDIGAVAIPCI